MWATSAFLYIFKIACAPVHKRKYGLLKAYTLTCSVKHEKVYSTAAVTINLVQRAVRLDSKIR
jgi:hypothetical protein